MINENVVLRRSHACLPPLRANYDACMGLLIFSAEADADVGAFQLV